MQGTSIIEMKNQRPPAHAKNPITLNSDLYLIWVKSYSVLRESYWRSLLPVVLFLLALELLVLLLELLTLPEIFVAEVFCV